MSAARTGKGVIDIAPDRLDALNNGSAEAATLTECLAVDFAVLMRRALPELDVQAIEIMQGARAEGILRRMNLAGRILYDRYGLGILETLRGHRSDTVRGWACFVIGTEQDSILPDRLAQIRPSADDSHFGVREWAWMAVRPQIAADLETAIAQLVPWTNEVSERLRRFASEATRPRGVWCAHIEALKQMPETALPLLEPLRADLAPYVQDSVGNWLNDASKSQPAWVQGVCSRWAQDSSSAATTRICKRALRSIAGKTS